MNINIINGIILALSFLAVSVGCTAPPIPSTSTISYSLLELDVSELPEDKLNIDITNSDELLHGSLVETLVISDASIRTGFEDNLYNEIGSVVECKGFSKKCIVISDVYRLALGDNFTFEQASTWEWKDFIYIASTKRRMVILGHPIDVVEVTGQNKQHPSIWVSFLISRENGIVYFKLNVDGFVQSYILSSDKGLWAAG